MTWFDLLLLLPIAALVVFEMRQEAGRSLLDATVTLAAVQLAAFHAGHVTRTMGWRPGPDDSAAPMAYGLCFAAFWGLGLLFTRTLHKRTRWSMDQFDKLFGFGFGLVVAVAFGHVLADFTADLTITRQGELPVYIRQSWVSDELRSFRSFQEVLEGFHQFQRGS